MEKDQPGVSLLFYGERSAWCKFTVSWREVCLVQVYCSMERGHPGVSLLFYGERSAWCKFTVLWREISLV